MDRHFVEFYSSTIFTDVGAIPSISWIVLGVRSRCAKYREHHASSYDCGFHRWNLSSSPLLSAKPVGFAFVVGSSSRCGWRKFDWLGWLSWSYYPKSTTSAPKECRGRIG